MVFYHQYIQKSIYLSFKMWPSLCKLVIQCPSYSHLHFIRNSWPTLYSANVRLSCVLTSLTHFSHSLSPTHSNSTYTQDSLASYSITGDYEDYSNDPKVMEMPSPDIIISSKPQLPSEAPPKVPTGGQKWSLVTRRPSLSKTPQVISDF